MGQYADVARYAGAEAQIIDMEAGFARSDGTIDLDCNIAETDRQKRLRESMEKIINERS